MTFKWHPFDTAKGYRQKRPPLRRNVLVMFPADLEEGHPPSVAVGYRKDSGGDRSLPFFVTPGIGGTPIFWCDCLGDDFETPAIPYQRHKWQMKQWDVKSGRA